ncbi:hypothetical protein BTM36_04575 [Herbaspirillum sp. VT-16-41]|nr:hypothetical protein BTM36_04575 [Herbaspirillum sp. VT-16-41]
MNIGDYKFDIYPDHQPDDWSMENDCWRNVEQLDDHTHRLVSWMGRVGYVVEYGGKAILLPQEWAMGVSRAIAADEAARRHALPGMRDTAR